MNNEAEKRPLRLLLTWRALSQLKSHADLILRVAEELPAEILVLDPLPIPWFEPGGIVRFSRISQKGAWRPPLRILTGWRELAEAFRPDAVLALDEAYCISTWQWVRWASGRGIPSALLSCQNIDRPLPLPFRLLESQTLRRVQGGWFLNQEAERRARSRGFAGVGEIIPLAVNPSDFPLLQSGSVKGVRREGGPDSPFTVGFVGRLVHEKGVGSLIEACARTGDSLLAVGDGPERGRLEREAVQRGVRAEWLGAVASDLIPSLYARMDVLALPSLETPRWKEQFGRVLIEAMAAGVPVIGSDSGEIPRVIADAGLLHPLGDSQALATGLLRLRVESGLRESLIQKGLERVRTHFTNPIIARRIADWVKRVTAITPDRAG